MKKNLLALFLALGLTLWAGTPAPAHPLSAAECEALRSYVRIHSIAVKSSSMYFKVNAVMEKSKEGKKILRGSASSLEEMHETLKKIVEALGCPLPKKKKAGKEQGKKK